MSESDAPYTPAHIANYFLVAARREGIPITHLQLQKLVYIAYAWYLALEDKDIFSEKIEAWKLGSVVPSLYQQFRVYKDKAIDDYAVNINDSAKSENERYPSVPKKDEKVRSILASVWSKYKSCPAHVLVNKTHHADSAWNYAYHNNKTINKDDEGRKKIKERAISAIEDFLLENEH